MTYKRLKWISLLTTCVVACSCGFDGKDDDDKDSRDSSEELFGTIRGQNWQPGSGSRYRSAVVSNTPSSIIFKDIDTDKPCSGVIKDLNRGFELEFNQSLRPSTDVEKVKINFVSWLIKNKNTLDIFLGEPSVAKITNLKISEEFIEGDLEIQDNKNQSNLSGRFEVTNCD